MSKCMVCLLHLVALIDPSPISTPFSLRSSEVPTPWLNCPSIHCCKLPENAATLSYYSWRWDCGSDYDSIVACLPAAGFSRENDCFREANRCSGQTSFGTWFRRSRSLCLLKRRRSRTRSSILSCVTWICLHLPLRFKGAHFARITTFPSKQVRTLIFIDLKLKSINSSGPSGISQFKLPLGSAV